MREPSSMEALYRWHILALSGLRPPVVAEHPECGWFFTRLVNGGPWLPVAIWCEQVIDPETGELAAPEMLRAMVQDRPRSPYHVWPGCARHPVTEAEYRAALVNDPEIMQATRVKVDLSAKPTRPRP